MAHVTIYPVPVLAQQITNIPVIMHGRRMGDGQQFPVTQDGNVQIPPNAIVHNITEILRWNGTVESTNIGRSQIDRHFWSNATIVDWLEENVSGRVAVVENSTYWTFGFNRYGGCKKFTDWINLCQPTKLPVTITSAVRFARISDWLEQSGPVGTAYFAANTPGIGTTYPQAVWIDHPDTAFAFKMAFCGEELPEVV